MVEGAEILVKHLFEEDGVKFADDDAGSLEADGLIVGADKIAGNAEAGVEFVQAKANVDDAVRNSDEWKGGDELNLLLQLVSEDVANDFHNFEVHRELNGVIGGINLVLDPCGGKEGRCLLYTSDAADE